jgi:hypothetical protein
LGLRACGLGKAIGTEGRVLATIEIDDALWSEFRAICERRQVQDPGAFFEGWLRRFIKQEGTVDGRYVPVACAIVTREDAEILVVGNEYVRGKPLVWNLPGGAVEPGAGAGAIRGKRAGGVADWRSGLGGAGLL